MRRLSPRLRGSEVTIRGQRVWRRDPLTIAGCAAGGPVLCCGCAADQGQIRNGAAEREVVENEHHPSGVAPIPDESGMLGGHGVNVLSHQQQRDGSEKRRDDALGLGVDFAVGQCML